MPRIDISAVRDRMRVSSHNPRLIARIVLGVLVLANMAAALIVFKPWAGSAGDIERRAADLRQQVGQREVTLDRLRGTVNKVQTGRTEGDHFMDGYLLSRRTVSSKLLSDLDRMARTANIRQKEVNFGFEPIEGSDTLSKASIIANYEAAYPDLVHFLNLLDRSPQLLIIDSLTATPQPQGMLLNITMKLNAFVREGGSAPSLENRGGRNRRAGGCSRCACATRVAVPGPARGFGEPSSSRTAATGAASAGSSAAPSTTASDAAGISPAVCPTTAGPPIAAAG